MTFNQPATICFNTMLCIITAFIAGCNSSNSNQNSTTSNNQSTKETTKAISNNAPIASSPQAIENLRIAAFSNLRMVLPITDKLKSYSHLCQCGEIGRHDGFKIRCL